MISKLAMLAKKTIEAAWLHGPSYDLATQAAEALESAQLLQSPETAAAHRSEALAEAEAAIAAAIDRNRDEHPTEQAMSARRLGMRAAERIVRGLREDTTEKCNPAEADAAPDFFRPGQTYIRNLPFRAPEDVPVFECVGVGVHPSKDALRAFGFERPGTGRPWASASQRTEEWNDGWVDLGPTKPDRLTRTFAPAQALREDQAHGDEPFVPRTERSRWEDIATALNAAHAAGMPVGIDLDGTLTDHRMWSVVWDRAAEQWTVAGCDAEASEADAGTPALVIYRACWDTMRLGRYTAEAEARKHCEDHARRDLPTASFDWIEDEEDGVAELVATVDGNEGPTGYTVTALEIASKYDPEADE